MATGLPIHMIIDGSGGGETGSGSAAIWGAWSSLAMGAQVGSQAEKGPTELVVTTLRQSAGARTGAFLALTTPAEQRSGRAVSSHADRLALTRGHG